MARFAFCPICGTPLEATESFILKRNPANAPTHQRGTTSHDTDRISTQTHTTLPLRGKHRQSIIPPMVMKEGNSVYYIYTPTPVRFIGKPHILEDQTY